jgi:hypothetical protein
VDPPDSCPFITDDLPAAFCAHICCIVETVLLNEPIMIPFLISILDPPEEEAVKLSAPLWTEKSLGTKNWYEWTVVLKSPC